MTEDADLEPVNTADDSNSVAFSFEVAFVDGQDAIQISFAQTAAIRDVLAWLVRQGRRE